MRNYRKWSLQSNVGLPTYWKSRYMRQRLSKPTGTLRDSGSVGCLTDVKNLLGQLQIDKVGIQVVMDSRHSRTRPWSQTQSHHFVTSYSVTGGWKSFSCVSCVCMPTSTLMACIFSYWVSRLQMIEMFQTYSSRRQIDWEIYNCNMIDGSSFARSVTFNSPCRSVTKMCDLGTVVRVHSPGIDPGSHKGLCYLRTLDLNRRSSYMMLGFGYLIPVIALCGLLMYPAIV